MNLLEAIAKEEGFYLLGSPAQRNHNPGNIEYGRFAAAHGAIGAAKGAHHFAIFPNDAAGFACMRLLFQAPAYKGKTIAQAIAEWAPPSENDTQSYIAHVCKWTGLSPDTIVDDHL